MLAGHLAVARGIALNDDDRLRRAIIERLMCDLAVDLDAVGAPFGKSAADFRSEIAALAPFIADGTARISGSKITMEPSARVAVRMVAAVFDSYLAKGNAIHAAAV